MRTLAILTNGGDTCSLNAAIKSVRDHAIRAGYTRVLGFEDGFSGIRERSVKLLTWEPIDPHQGGTVLRSQRWAPTSDDEKRALFAILADLEVGVLVVIGGDGSLAAARDLHQWLSAKRHLIRVLGFPRTIDNDIRTTTLEASTEVALCPGYPSAAFKIARFAKELRTTAMSSRKIFIMETMGRDAGWLAAAAALGGAELVLIPEVTLSDADWERFYERVAKLYSIHGHVIIAVSEGFRIDGCQEMDAAFGPRKLGGVGIKVAKRVESALKARGIGAGVRYQQAGYIPRMGSPTLYDIELASALGRKLGDLLEEGCNGELPVPARTSSIADLQANVSSTPLASVGQFFFPALAFYHREGFGVTDTFLDFVKKFVNLLEI
jgi:6-phosphofructokinase